MDFQRLIAFVVFSFSLLMIWQSWQDYNNPQKPAVSAQSAKAPVCHWPDDRRSADARDKLCSRKQRPTSSSVETGARAIVKTDVLSAVIDAHGGDIRELTLPNYRENEDQSKLFKLFEERAGRNYFAQSGYIGGTLPNHKTVFELVPGEYALKAGENTLKLPMKAVTGQWRRGDQDLHVHPWQLCHRRRYPGDQPWHRASLGLPLLPDYASWQGPGG
jgi:YidC/Oxa1 family membrane protein insertase